MFRWAIIFAVIALIASLLGFGGVAGLSKDFAIILLVIAVILAIVGFLSRGKVYSTLRLITKKKDSDPSFFICAFKNNFSHFSSRSGYFSNPCKSFYALIRADHLSGFEHDNQYSNSRNSI